MRALWFTRSDAEANAMVQAAGRRPRRLIVRPETEATRGKGLLFIVMEGEAPRQRDDDAAA